MDAGSRGAAGLVALLALTATACGDGLPTLFQVPTDLRVEGAVALEGTVGWTARPLPTFVVVDGRGRPVPEVEVTFRAEEGSGSVTPASATSDEHGRVTPQLWLLGPTPGSHAFVAELPERASVRVEAWAAPGPPDHFVALSPIRQEAPVATTVAELPGARLNDRFGNPLAGVEVRFVPEEESGEVAGALTTTDEDGIATLAEWTLSSRSGEQGVRVRLEASPTQPAPLRFVVVAQPGPAVDMVPASATAQDAEVNLPVLDPPAVRFLDEFGNSVPGETASFTVVEGGGSVEGSPATSGSDGIARVESWTTGPELGTNRLVASAGALGDVEFVATGVPIVLAFTVEGVHLNQASQRLEGDMGGVSGRTGILRVVVRANQPNTETPDVLVRLFQGESLVREALLPANRDGVPTDPDLASLSDSWNLVLWEDEVLPGLAVSVEVDPDSVVEVGSRAGHVFPEGGGTLPLDVQPIVPFRLLFIPVTATAHDGATGDISPALAGEFLVDTRLWLPVNDIEYVIDAPFVTDQNLTTTAGWNNLLNALQAKRTAEGATDEYYHGIVPSIPGIRWQGLAYIPDSPDSPLRTGITWDNLPGPPGASWVLAHELGHNLGRRHSPCGNPGGLDPDYPYEDGLIGVPGYHIVSHQLLAPWLTYDFMSYCSQPAGTSDYTWEGLLAWRRADPLAPGNLMAAGAHGSAGARAAGASGEGRPEAGILLWGRVHGDGVELNPAFHLEAPASLPREAGPHQLRGTDGDGRELFRFTFRTVPPGHGSDPAEGHFSFFVPLAPAHLAALARIELASPRGRAVQESAVLRLPDHPGPPLRDPEVAVDRLTGERVRLRWDGERFPMAMLRDPESGRVLGFGRSGDLVVPDRDRRADRLEVHLSDGVGSARARRR